MKISTKLSILAFASSNLIFGSLIPFGLVPSSGAGLGAVETTLTLTSPANTSTATGCVGAGIGGVEITGSSVCPEASGIAGGNEQAVNNTFTTSQLGLVDFSNLQLIVNASEPGNTSNQSVSLDLLALSLFNPATGLIVDTFYTEEAFDIPAPVSGTGGAGFAFELDDAQAARANAALAEFINLNIGVAANLSDATGGLTTVFLRVNEGDGGGGNPSEIPEPSTYALVGFGLLSAAYMSRRKA